MHTIVDFFYVDYCGVWQHQYPLNGSALYNIRAERWRPKPPKIKYSNNSSSLRQKLYTKINPM